MQTTYLQYSFVHLLAILILQYYLTKVEIYYKQAINKISREEQNGREKKRKKHERKQNKSKWKQKHTRTFTCRLVLFLIGIEKVVCDLYLLFSIDNLLLRYARKASK